MQIVGLNFRINFGVNVISGRGLVLHWLARWPMQTASSTILELEDLRGFLINKGICPHCKGTRGFLSDEENGEIVCQECGFTQRIYSPQSRCSGVGNGDGRHDAPVNDLCFGRNLGARLQNRSLLQILRKRGTVDLGIRRIQVRNEIMRSQEKPITQRIKSYLSDWSKMFGWRDQVLFANTLGSHAHWVGTCLTLMKDGRNSKELAKGIFSLTVKRFFGDEKIPLIEAKLKPKKLFIKKARDIITLDKLVK